MSTLLTRTESAAQAIRRERRPLPSHELAGQPYRRHFAAVCQAEVDHRRDDFWRAALKVPVLVDRYSDPDCHEMGQFAHEMHAGAALNWLSHLQAHESRLQGDWPYVKWSDPAERAAWLADRRPLWAGFLRQVERYREARRAIDAPMALAAE